MKPRSGRRWFLASLAGGAAAAAAAPFALRSAPPAAQGARPSAYRLTAHIRRYYRSTSP